MCELYIKIPTSIKSIWLEHSCTHLFTFTVAASVLQWQNWIVGTKLTQPVTCQPSPVEPFKNQESYQQICAALNNSLWPVVLVEGTALILHDCQECWAGDTCFVCGRPSAGIWEPLKCLLLRVSHVLTLCLPKQTFSPSLLYLGRFFISPLKNPPGRILYSLSEVFGAWPPSLSFLSLPSVSLPCPVQLMSVLLSSPGFPDLELLATWLPHA